MYKGRSCTDRKTKTNNAWTKQELLIEANKLGYKNLSAKSKEEICNLLLSNKNSLNTIPSKNNLNSISSTNNLNSMSSMKNLNTIPSINNLNSMSSKNSLNTILSINNLNSISSINNLNSISNINSMSSKNNIKDNNLILPSIPNTDLFEIGRERNRLDEIKDAENIRENLIWLSNIYPQAVNKWRLSINSRCESLDKIHPEIKNLCQNKDYIINLINSMISWMNQYILVRNNNLEPSEDQLREILDLLTSFTIITSFFENKMNFFTSKKKDQDTYKAILSEVIIKLIGCRELVYFFLIPLFTRMNHISKYDQDRIEYLSNRCRQLRQLSLKIF